MRIYYIRHGETPWNRDFFLQGRTNISLNENGRASAVLTGKGLSGVRFDLCVTSPLDRAMETAELILRQNSRELPGAEPALWPAGTVTERNGVRFFTDARLIEYCFGVWEGLCYKGPGKTLPIASYSDFWAELNEAERPEGSEAFTDFFARVTEFLNELDARFGQSEMNILVVAHGAVSRGIRHVLCGDATSMKNCEAQIIEKTADGLAITGRQDFSAGV